MTSDICSLSETSVSSSASIEEYGASDGIWFTMLSHICSSNILINSFCVLGDPYVARFAAWLKWLAGTSSPVSALNFSNAKKLPGLFSSSLVDSLEASQGNILPTAINYAWNHTVLQLPIFLDQGWSLSIYDWAYCFLGLPLDLQEILLLHWRSDEVLFLVCRFVEVFERWINYDTGSGYVEIDIQYLQKPPSSDSLWTSQAIMGYAFYQDFLNDLILLRSFVVEGNWHIGRQTWDDGSVECASLC